MNDGLRATNCAYRRSIMGGSAIEEGSTLRGGDALTNEEYVRRLGILYNKVLSLRRDEDYIVNQPQMEKLVALLEFFLDMAEDLDGKVEPVELKPREEHGGVTATFLVFDLYEEKVTRFCDVMRGCSAIGIDTTIDGEVCISCTVPDVFVHK